MQLSGHATEALLTPALPSVRELTPPVKPRGIAEQHIQVLTSPECAGKIRLLPSSPRSQMQQPLTTSFTYQKVCFRGQFLKIHDCDNVLKNIHVVTTVHNPKENAVATLRLFNGPGNHA